jgi:hypothetical protein
VRVFCPRCRDEFREGFTWCRGCDVALVDTLPEAPPELLPEPAAGSSAVAVPEDGRDEARVLRLRGLGLVLMVALAVPLFARLEYWMEPSLGLAATSAADFVRSELILGVETLALVGVMVYVLFRQGRSWRELGLTARGSDLLYGAALAPLGRLCGELGERSLVAVAGHRLPGLDRARAGPGRLCVD